MSASRPRLKPLRILALMHEDLMPPASIEGLTEEQIHPWKMEYDVKVSLERMGHDVHPVGIYGDLSVLREALDRIKPDIVLTVSINKTFSRVRRAG